MSKIPTQADWKKFNKTYTTRQLPVVKICGHKVDPDLPPKSNCISCWFAYFNASGENVNSLSLGLSEGEADMVAANGKKFVKFFKMFTIAVQTAMEEDGKK